MHSTALWCRVLHAGEKHFKRAARWPFVLAAPARWHGQCVVEGPAHVGSTFAQESRTAEQSLLLASPSVTKSFSLLHASTMANIATLLCSMMLAQVERDNRRAARRQERLLGGEPSLETTSSLIPNALMDDKLFARLLRKDSSLKELLITEEFFLPRGSLTTHGSRIVKARDLLSNMVRGGDNVKWCKVRKALLRHSSLQKLEIHYTIFDENDKFLSQILVKMPQLTHLTLCGNHVGDAGACLLAKSLVTSKTTLLRCLILENNKVQNDGAAHLATALSSSRTTLTHLSLKQNFIKSAGASALARMLNLHNTTLEKLDLSRNFIHSTGAMALAASLHHNTTLKELNLSYNDNQVTLQCIGDAGAKAFGSALSKNDSLQVLVLSGNHVGASGCKALAAGLAKNTGLKELYLDNNSIGIEGLLALLQALETNTTLQILSLEDTMVPIEASVQQALVNTLHKNTSLQELHSTVVNEEGAFLLELNRGLRKLLRDECLPTALWPYVLARASRETSEYMRLNLAHYAIQEKSDLFRR